MRFIHITILIIIIAYLFYVFRKVYPILPTVQYLDLNKYSGLWYEIARFPNYFQKGCINSTANYTLQNDGNIKVVNRCIINDKIIEVNGIAKPISPGRLNVYFGNSFVVGEYNVIYVDPNYQYALVGTTDRSNLWILSRTKNINQKNFQELISFAKDLGFDTNKLIGNSFT